MYTSHFGFREKPFNVTPNPRFFYTNRGYQEAYANLLYGIRERKGFLVLTGEVGTGKTTILRRLMDNLEANVAFVFFYNTTLTFDELLSFICAELSLRVNGEGQLAKIQALNEFLLDQLRKKSTAVLFIDEAQNLKEEVFESLRLLSNLETANEKLLQIVLAGQPELEAKLGRPEMRQLRQRVALQWRLDCLTEEEVGAFIDYRLKAAGYERNDLFHRDAIREIAFYSKGIPRLINSICDNALLIAYAVSRKTVSANIVREVASDLRLESEVRLPAAQPTTFTPPSGDRGRNGDRTAILGRGSIASAKTELYSVKLDHGPAPATLPPTPVRSAIDTVPPEFMTRLTTALAEAMGPMAPLVIRDRIAALGESPQAFPITRLLELVQSVSREILHEKLKGDFHRMMTEEIQAL